MPHDLLVCLHLQDLITEYYQISNKWLLKAVSLIFSSPLMRWFRLAFRMTRNVEVNWLIFQESSITIWPTCLLTVEHEKKLVHFIAHVKKTSLLVFPPSLFLMKILMCHTVILWRLTFIRLSWKFFLQNFTWLINYNTGGAWLLPVSLCLR